MTQTIIQNIEVRHCYAVHFSARVFAADNPVLRRILPPQHGVSVGAVIDEGVAVAHPTLVDDLRGYFKTGAIAPLVAAPLVLPGGEACKNDPAYLDAVHGLIHDAGLCRHSAVIAVGGGALLDMVGFAAATAHRGVRLIRVPTTVLAQNDSGVGVKNGVNAFGKKNFMGTFAPPFAVVNDHAFLETLSDRDWVAGLAEAVKVALLRDGAFFGQLEQLRPALLGRDAAAMQKVVYRCAQLHLQHIAACGDPFETGSSRPLDLGHWCAHKLEALTAFELRHGEAVALGIALDATYAYRGRQLSELAWRRIVTLLGGLGFLLWHPAFRHTDELFAGLEEFRAHLGGRLAVPMLRDIGDPFDAHDVDFSRMRDAIGLLERVNTNLHRGDHQWDEQAQAA